MCTKKAMITFIEVLATAFLSASTEVHFRKKNKNNSQVAKAFILNMQVSNGLKRIQAKS